MRATHELTVSTLTRMALESENDKTELLLEAEELVAFVALVSCGGASSDQIIIMGKKAFDWIAKAKGDTK